MKKQLFFSLSLLVLGWNSFAQVGSQFPTLSGTTLEDKSITVPIDTKGKFTLLGLAYSKGAEAELKTWYQPIYSTFIEKSKPGLFAAESHNVNLYFIPMFTGLNQSLSGSATKKMKEGFDAILFPYILVYKGELKPYKDKLDFEKKDTPYFFVLDKEGKIIHAFSGKYTDEKLAQIEELIAE